jgi:hypothetical protein
MAGFVRNAERFVKADSQNPRRPHENRVNHILGLRKLPGLQRNRPRLAESPDLRLPASTIP